MAYVAVLVSNPEAPAVDGRVCSMVVDALPHAGAARILNAGIAAEIPFARPDRPLAEITVALRQILAGRPIDVAVMPEAGRRKRLLLADMDSTMIRQECIDELADCVGLKDRVSAITARAMRGEIAFEPALRERVLLLAGLPEGICAEIIRDRITFMPGGRALVATMRASGAYTALVSGGFTHFTGPISQTIGFHEHRANVLGVVGGKLVGTVHEPILGREAKRERLLALCAEKGLVSQDVIAVGDGANDLAMLAEAGFGVALHAKPAVAEAAGYRIDHGDLTALLYLQGYAVGDFAN